MSGHGMSAGLAVPLLGEADAAAEVGEGEVVVGVVATAEAAGEVMVVAATLVVEGVVVAAEEVGGGWWGRGRRRLRHIIRWSK